MLKIKLLPGEVAKDIAGYEGLYKITTFGRVYGYARKIFRVGWLKSDGYLFLGLSKHNKRKCYSTHRLVALHFISNPDNLPEVNHKDGNKLNNNVNNLEWCTHVQNMNHAVTHKLMYHRHNSKYFGISYNRNKNSVKKPWVACVCCNNRTYMSKYFKTDVEAAKAYNSMIIKLNLDRPLNKI